MNRWAGAHEAGLRGHSRCALSRYRRASPIDSTLLSMPAGLAWRSVAPLLLPLRSPRTADRGCCCGRAHVLGRLWRCWARFLRVPTGFKGRQAKLKRQFEEAGVRCGRRVLRQEHRAGPLYSEASHSPRRLCPQRNPAKKEQRTNQRAATAPARVLACGVGPMSGEREASGVLFRLTVVLVPVLFGCSLWALYQSNLFSARFRPVATTTSQAPTKPVSSSAPVKAGPIDVPTRTVSGVADDVVLLSNIPFSSIPIITPSTDPDPIAGFRQLMTLPPEPPRPLPHIDPRILRKILDRGVVTYASSATDADRAKGASLIQIAALVGFPPARDLLARNYPQSAAVRSVVPANDAVRYALDFFKDPANATDDFKRVLFALARHFSLEGELDLFATHLLNSLRGDSRPQLSHRIDILLELLGQVRGACMALARFLPMPGELSEQKCLVSLGDPLRRYIETGPPGGQEEESRRRGLLLLSQIEIP